MQKLFQCVLPVLRCPAYRVKKTEVLFDLAQAVLLDHRCFQTPLHFLSFAPQHGRLVRDADTLEVNIRIEAFGVSALEFLEKLRLVATSNNVIAYVIRLPEGEYHQIVSGPARPGLGTGGFGFFMPGFAVDDAGHSLLGILANTFPDAHYVATGSIHEQATLFFELLARGDLGAKGRDNDNVLGAQLVDLLVARLARDGHNAQPPYLIVDLGVMDDFAQ